MIPFILAQRLAGEVTERPASADHPFILWCLESTGLQDVHDEVPWCSAFVNRLHWLLRLPRSKSARARSWLVVGVVVETREAALPGDIVVLSRGDGPQPNATVLDAPGHVGFFAGWDGADVLILGGNHSNGISVERFKPERILGIRRIVAS